MFRIILLIFIFLYFNGNFFYGFALSYIPFKNAQSINIYNMYKVFEDPNFTTFMNNPTLTGSIYKIENLGTIRVEKTSSTGIILKLPYKVNHRYGDQLEILIPIINDTGDINQNDTQFNNMKYLHKNNFIENGQSYLKFGINYDTVKSQSDLNNLTLKNYNTIWLNKLYITRGSPTNNPAPTGNGNGNGNAGGNGNGNGNAGGNGNGNAGGNGNGNGNAGGNGNANTTQTQTQTPPSVNSTFLIR